jgi:hypothetical protein
MFRDRAERAALRQAHYAGTSDVLEVLTEISALLVKPQQPEELYSLTQ